MNNRVGNCQLEDILKGENYGVECDEYNDTSIHDMANDLLDARIRAEATEQATKEARELIKEMREDLLKISQYPIAFVCEEARIIAREAWKKSKEYAE